MDAEDAEVTCPGFIPVATAPDASPLKCPGSRSHFQDVLLLTSLNGSQAIFQLEHTPPPPQSRLPSAMGLSVGT